MHLATKTTTVIIHDQEGLTRTATRLAASGIEELAKEPTAQPAPENAFVVPDERFKFTAHINDLPERAFLQSVTFHSDKTAVCTARVTIFHSPIMSYRHDFTVSRVNGVWTARIDNVARIAGD